MKKRSRLSEFEAFVRGKANKFARREADFDDFYQEGMLAVWQALEDDPGATRSYVYQRVEWRMLDHVKRRIYKYPEEFSVGEGYNNLLYADYSFDD